MAYVNVGCYYVVGIPLGCLLGFKFDLGAKVYKLITLSFPCLTHTNPMPMWDDIAPSFSCTDTQNYYSYRMLHFTPPSHPHFIEFGSFPIHWRGAGSFFLRGNYFWTILLLKKKKNRFLSNSLCWCSSKPLDRPLLKKKNHRPIGTARLSQWDEDIVYNITLIQKSHARKYKPHFYHTIIPLCWRYSANQPLNQLLFKKKKKKTYWLIGTTTWTE